MLGGTPQEVSRHGRFVEGGSGPNGPAAADWRKDYSVTGFSEICQSLPSKIEMWSVFIGE
jgi:hypothetical protein